MRIYIAGRNGPPSAFGEAANRLAGAGYVPVNPVGRSELEAQLMLETADGLALLPGWHGSDAAEREHFHAVCKGMQIGTIDEWVKWDVGRCIRWIGDPACAPVRHYEGDAGFDLTVSARTRIHVDDACDVPLGINIQLPPGVWALLVGRSSTLRRRGLLVAQAVIDNGYRGSLFAYCHNLSGHIVELEPGERVAQLIPMALASAGIGLRQSALDLSDRGTRAFGSTGGFAHSSSS